MAWSSHIVLIHPNENNYIEVLFVSHRFLFVHLKSISGDGRRKSRKETIHLSQNGAFFTFWEKREKERKPSFFCCFVLVQGRSLGMPIQYVAKYFFVLMP